MWARHESELFYLAGDRLMTVRIEAEPLRVSSPVPLFELDGPINRYGGKYDVAPDGRVLVSRSDEEKRSFRIVLNWLEELKRLVPTEE